MLTVWTVLLCGLLPFQQAAAQDLTFGLDFKTLEKVLPLHPSVMFRYNTLLGEDLPDGIPNPIGVFTPVTDFVRRFEELIAEASFRRVQSNSGAPKLVVENYMTDPAHIEVLSGRVSRDLNRVLRTRQRNMDTSLSNVLNRHLPGVLYPGIDVLLNNLNMLLGTVNSVLPVGTLGWAHYTLAGPPSMKDGQLLLNMNIYFSDNNGNTFNPVPAEPPALPPVTDDTSRLLLSLNILRPWLELLVKGGQFNADIPQQMLPDVVPMTTSELESILSEVSGRLPANTSLVVRMGVIDTPAVTLQNGTLTVTLNTTMKCSGLTPLLVLEADMKLTGQPIISGTKLHLSLALDSFDLRLVSSEIGDIDVGLLKNWILDILQIAYIPRLNVALDKAALPLPNILNMGYADGQANILGNIIMVPLTPKLP